MRGSRNFRQEGGGGPRHVNLTKKALTFLFFFLFFFSYSFAFLIEVKWLISKKNIIFQGSGGGTHFSRGGGGVRLFPGGGVHCLFPIETHITCDFQWGVPTPCPPSGPAFGCNLFSFPVRKMMRSPLAPMLVFLQLRCMYSVEPKIVS